uniref:Uncharacterized protein n=1 Tax=Oryzias sinensis TaxID=183150 RepID=A0A8C7WMM5_9TELE
MADDELEAIRRQRMAELQAKHGVSFMHEQETHVTSAILVDTDSAHPFE